MNYCGKNGQAACPSPRYPCVTYVLDQAIFFFLGEKPLGKGKKK